MLDLLKKMNYKGQSPVVVLNAPDGFAQKLTQALPDIEVVSAMGAKEKTPFLLIFATQQRQIDDIAPQVAEWLEADGLLWFAYPKGSSKRFKCDFNRDTGWQILGHLGFEPVRQVAIDEDWSALRFRRAEFIKTMTRSSALSEAGKKKIGK